MAVLEIEDLVLDRGPEFRLGPVSLSVASGARLALLGPSGSGKTTLLRCIAGLETPTHGRVTRGAPGAPAPRIGFVFQDGALWPHMTAERHLRFVDPGLSAAQARALLDRVGIADLAARRPAELSGGEAQRLALARALAGAPDVLLLDEPLHSVDVYLRDELRVLLRTVAREHVLTTVLVTHDPQDAFVVCDDLAVLRDGRVVEQDTVQQLVRQPGTAWTASFLCGAVCFAATAGDNGCVRTPFGALPRPAGAAGPVSLAVLPGDVEVASPGEAGPRAQVLRVLPMGDHAVVTVVLAGRTLQAIGRLGEAVADEVGLVLRGDPRLLPAGGEEVRA